MKIYNNCYKTITTTLSYFVSWSGGKDSTLALHRAMETYGPPKFLFTIMNESGERSAGHGIHKDVLLEQSHCLEIPIVFFPSTWDTYENKFQYYLKSFKLDGIEKAIFGDIHLDRSWIDAQCQNNQIESYEPLWYVPKKELIDDLTKHRFTAHVIALHGKKLSPDYLGKLYNWNLVTKLKNDNADILGEEGEFHTIVTDGPIFKRPLKLRNLKRVQRGDYWFLDVEVFREKRSTVMQSNHHQERGSLDKTHKLGHRKHRIQVL